MKVVVLTPDTTHHTCVIQRVAALHEIAGTRGAA